MFEFFILTSVDTILHEIFFTRLLLYLSTNKNITQLGYSKRII